MQELLSNINWAVIAPFLIIQLVLMVVALTDLARAKQTKGSKWLWAAVICFVNIIGPVLYFIIGRRES